MSLASEQWVAMYPTIDAHLEHCRAAGFSADTTITDRREVLERMIRDLGDLHTATADQFAHWLGRGGWAPQTRANYYNHAKAYLRWCVRQGIVTVNPFDQLDRPKVPSYIPRSVDDATWRRLATDPTEPYRTATILAGYGGLRCFEVCGARREDFTEETITILGKGGRVDQIPTSPAIWSHVRDLPPGLLVHTARTGAPYPPKMFSGRYGGHCRALGLDAALHDMRRHFADALRRAGVDIEVIRTLMRHTSLATTQRYFAPREEERRAGIQALPLVA
jgi:integrase